MDVDKDDTVRAAALQGVGHDTGADGLAAAGHALLAGVGKVGHHGRDAVHRRPPKGVEIEQQLHERVVDRCRTGLDEKDVVAAHQVVDLDVNLGVGQLGRG